MSREICNDSGTHLRSTSVTKGLTSVQPEQEKFLLEHAAYVDECKGTNLNKDWTRKQE